MSLSLITGCAIKTKSQADDIIETTVVSDEELNKNARKVTEALPDISISNINEPLNGNGDTTINGQPFFNMKGTVTAIDGFTITIAPDDIMSEQTLTATDDTIVSFQDDSEILAASLSDVSVGNLINYSYNVLESGEELLSTITIINMTSNTTADTK